MDHTIYLRRTFPLQMPAAAKRPSAAAVRARMHSCDKLIDGRVNFCPRGRARGKRCLRADNCEICAPTSPQRVIGGCGAAARSRTQKLDTGHTLVVHHSTRES